MKKSLFLLGILVSAFLGGVVASLGVYAYLFKKNDSMAFQSNHNARFSNYSAQSDPNFTVPEGLNFVMAAGRVTPAVVHIKTYYEGYTDKEGMDDLSLEDMLDWYRKHENDSKKGRPRGFSTGSGVIITEDGYIITNHHVIEEGEKVEVVLDDKKSFEAAVIGSDPTTDLALLKIDQRNLPFVVYGNSDDLKVGEWVLAIGNPFDLTSTVTAGIISAKSRDIDIIRSSDGLSIESFIQTDAAVNPGNSGGALVNLKGELIGINTAIATSTGSYAGFSFAVPVTLVEKVAKDLQEFGEVQRALLGVRIQDIDVELMKEQKLKSMRGIYVSEISPGGAAQESGIKIGDVIVKVNDTEVNTVSALQEMVARFRPGDKIDVIYERAGIQKAVSLVLKNKNNSTEVLKTEREVINVQEVGADLCVISNEEKKQLQIKNGIKVVKLYDGKFKAGKIPKGFVITHIDKIKLSTVADLQTILRHKSGGVLIEGLDPNGEKAFYGIGF